MSFALDQDDDQTDSQADQTKSDDSSVSLGGGGSGVATAGGNPVATQPGQAGKPSSSGSWTNLQSYLDANSDQGAQVGSQIAGTVNQQAQTAQSDVNSAASDFQNNVNSSTINADPDAVNKAISDATSAKAGSTLDPNDVSGYQAQANATYNGPTDFTQEQGYGQAQQDLNTAQQSVAETGSEAGRDVLLGNQYKNSSANGYNQGEQNLDQLLLESSQGGKAALQPLANQWSGLSTALGNATTTENAAAQSAAATDAATQQAAQAALTGATTGFQTNLTNAATAAAASAPHDWSQLMTDLSDGNLTPSELAAVNAQGLNTGANTYDLFKDPTQYFTENSAPTMYQTATADQYAQAAALAQLAGQTDSTFLPSEQASQAGTANPFTFQGNKFDQAQQTAARAYATALAPLTTAAQSIQGQIAQLQAFIGSLGSSTSSDNAMLTQDSNQRIAALQAQLVTNQKAQQNLGLSMGVNNTLGSQTINNPYRPVQR